MSSFAYYVVGFHCGEGAIIALFLSTVMVSPPFILPSDDEFSFLVPNSVCQGFGSLITDIFL